MDDLSLKQFVDMDRSGQVSSYVAALEAFDVIPQMQELRALGRERSGIAAGRRVLDVGCGFGIETLRLAAAAGPERNGRRHRQERGLHRRRRRRAAAARSRGRLPHRRRGRPALGRRAASTACAPSDC